MPERPPDIKLSTPPRPDEDLRAPFRFGRKILLFLSPLLVILTALEGLLWATGETVSITRVIAAQQANPTRLFMRGILDQGFYRYKHQLIQSRKPKVLVLGSSRVMEFRAEMFGVRSNDFFNAGGMIQDLGDLDHFVRSLPPDQTPDVVILGLDLWWFNRNKPLLQGLESGVQNDAALDWQEHLRALRRFRSSRTRNPAFSALRARNKNIGIEARHANVGFRADGSMQYNFPTPDGGWKFIDREKPPIPERIKNGTSQFTPAPGASLERLQLLQSTVNELQSRSIIVLAFLPPFSSESAALMVSSGAHSNLWTETRHEVAKVFNEKNIPFVDSSLLSALNLNDSYLVDGIHPAETFHLHLLARFLEDERVKHAFPRLIQLTSSAIQSPKTNPWHPDYETYFNSLQ